MNKRIGILAILILEMFAGKGQTQLTLIDAIKLGLKSNFQIQIAEQNLEKSQLNNNLGDAGILPSLNLSTSNSNSLGQNNNRASFVGQLSDGNLTLNNSIRNSVELNWKLFGGFGAWITKSKLALLEEQSIGNKEIVVENTIQAIILAYYRIQLEKEKALYQQEILDLSQRRFQKVKANKEMGSASTFDLLQVKNNYLMDSAALIQQEIILEKAENQLKLLLNISPEAEIQLSDSLQLKQESFLYPDIKAKTLQNNRNLENQFLNQMVFQKDVEIRKAMLMPSLSMNVGNSYNWNKFDIPGLPANSGFELPSIGSSSDYYINFSLSFNVFNGLQMRRSIERAKIDQMTANLNYEEMKRSVEHSLFNQFKDYQMKLSLYQLQSSIKESAQLNLDLAIEKWELGVLNSIDYRSIENDYLSAKYSYLLSLYNVLESHTELVRLTGGLIKDIATK